MNFVKYTNIRKTSKGKIKLSFNKDGCSLKVPERYKECLRVSSSVKGKSLSSPPRGREWAMP